MPESPKVHAMKRPNWLISPAEWTIITTRIIHAATKVALIAVRGARVMWLVTAASAK